MPVTRFEITLRRPLAGEPAYEELKGRLHFAIDPLHPGEPPHHRRRAGAARRARARDVGVGRVHPAAGGSRAVQRARAPRRRQPRQYGSGAQFQPRHAARLRARVGPEPEPEPEPEPSDRRGRRLPDEAGLGGDLLRLAGRPAARAGAHRYAHAGSARRPGPAPAGPHLHSGAVHGPGGRLPALGPRPRALSRRGPRGAGRAPHRAGSAGRAGHHDPARALALRPRGGRPRGARRQSHPSRRRLREGAALPDHLHRGGRAGAGPRDGRAAGQRRLAQARRGGYGQSRAGAASLGLRLRAVPDRAAAAHPDLRGSQPRRAGARGTRRRHRQRGGRHARRVQPAVRPALQGPQ